LILRDNFFARPLKKTSHKISWWAMLAALSWLCGCAAGEPPQYASASAAPTAQTAPGEQAASAVEPAGAQEPGFTGLWEGTSTSGCMPLQPEARRCDAVVKITLQMFQKGSTLTGHYTCETGTMVCRDSNSSGTIADGRVREGNVGMRVMMPDGSSCLFNGRPSQDKQNKLTGTYFCMQGGGYIEQGRFQVERSY
jgi:hypothetical protein